MAINYIALKFLLLKIQDLKSFRFTLEKLFLTYTYFTHMHITLHIMTMSCMSALCGHSSCDLHGESRPQFASSIIFTVSGFGEGHSHPQTMCPRVSQNLCYVKKLQKLLFSLNQPFEVLKLTSDYQTMNSILELIY